MQVERTPKKYDIMKIYTEQSLCYFQFWSGAVENAKMLTASELDEVESVLEELYPEGVDETTINDLFWFSFDEVCAAIGLVYDINEDKIIREED